MLAHSLPAPVAARPVTIRTGMPVDADALFELIGAHQTEGHLLPRERAELKRRAPRFVIASAAGRVVGCAELVALSSSVAEIRSLVVAADHRGQGLAGRLVEVLRERAVAEGFATVTAFTHDARLFIRSGFSIAPHQWVPEKIARDCSNCPLFPRCGQRAMLLPLKEAVRHGANVEDGRARVA